MASQGPSLPSTASSESHAGTTISWLSPSAALTNDGSNASATGSDGQPLYSEWLLLKGFGFSIPTGATIDGVKVLLRRSATGNSPPGSVQTGGVQLWISSAGSSTTKQDAGNWNTSPESVEYGDASDLWGESPAPADINDTNFGTRLHAEYTISSGSFANVTALVDYVEITVYYTTAGGSGSQSRHLPLLGVG